MQGEMHMNTAVMPDRTTEASPRSYARIARVFYLLTFITGIAALLVDGWGGLAAGITAGGFYVAVTLVLYGIFKPVSRNLSLLAAVVSLVGCAIGPLSFFLPGLSRISPLVFFGFYCLLIGYLVFRTTFLPRFLGGAMVFAGLGWLTFLSPTLAKSLSPYVLVPGIVGEGLLTVWLLAAGVNEERWKEQASVAK